MILLCVTFPSPGSKWIINEKRFEGMEAIKQVVMIEFKGIQEESFQQSM